MCVWCYKQETTTSFVTKNTRKIQQLKISAMMVGTYVVIFQKWDDDSKLRMWDVLNHCSNFRCVASNHHWGCTMVVKAQSRRLPWRWKWLSERTAERLPPKWSTVHRLCSKQPATAELVAALVRRDKKLKYIRPRPWRSMGLLHMQNLQNHGFQY